MDTATDNALTRLIDAGFPSWRNYDERCGLRRSMLGGRWSARPDIVAIGDAIQRAGQFEGFAGRLRRTHPAGEHRAEHDRQFWDAFTEGEALAWALDVAKLGIPSLVDKEGHPDLYIPEKSLWVEAKSVRESDDGRRLSEGLFGGASDDDPRMYGPSATTAAELETTWLAVRRQLDDHRRKALTQLTHVAPEKGVLFVEWQLVDIDRLDVEDELRARTKIWAAAGAVRVPHVVSFNWDWPDAFAAWP